MAEVIEVPYAVESGKNADELIAYQHKPDSAIFQGTADALAPVMVQMGKVPSDILQPDIPYSLDDYARALESDRTVLYRVNFRGQTVPKRWYEYGEDRQDIGIGILADYLVAPALKVTGYWLAGCNENEIEAEKSIKDIHDRYPINPRWEAESLMHRFKHRQKEVPETDLLIEDEKAKEKVGEHSSQQGYYRVIREFPLNSGNPLSYEETEKGITIKFEKK